ncbi:protein Lines homolog 1 [Trichomycterus rosablanca]|uniref:protein Lines homolog 1 n=1 Tax=Trichomycterus rosablanca TaxID=2290929 RepID=UPI002F35E956
MLLLSTSDPPAASQSAHFSQQLKVGEKRLCADDVEMDSERSDLLAAFTRLHSGLVPAMSAEELARRISSLMHASSQTSVQARGASSDDLEVTGLCLTLLFKIVSKCSSRDLPPDASMFYHQTLMRLLEAADFAECLVDLLSCGDRLLSHLAAKCVSSSIIYSVCKQGDSGGVWSSFTKRFQNWARLGAPDTPLWVLTQVIKWILRGDAGNKAEILRNVLAPFEATISSMFSELLVQDEHLSAGGSTADLQTLLCALLDLMEVLTAARTRHGLCSSIQSLTFLRTSALLRLSRCHTAAFVRRRALLLIKRTLLQKAGDDLGLDGAPPAPCDRRYAADLLEMVHAVLREVGAGWLQELHVEPRAGCFGGNRDTPAGGAETDLVTLRAVSLIIIKSLEIQTQHRGSEGSHELLDVQQHLLKLLEFLQQKGLQVESGPQRCSWILAVFAEQDDDLMESLKALSALYSHRRRWSCSDVEVCNWGCNPHCHFILLLQSLSFDHTVLLDFLISAETCFLEYLVLYLKQLRDRWQDFCSACARIQGSERTSRSSETGTSGGSRGASVPPRAQAAPLVDYESSEEEEDQEEEEDRNQTELQTRSRAEEPVPERSVEEISSDSSGSLMMRIMWSLAELQTVIIRLDSRGLFPYTPTSLLKLLAAVQEKGSGSAAQSRTSAGVQSKTSTSL